MRALFALNSYIWKYRIHLCTGILFVIISNIFAVYPAQIVRGAINLVEDVLHLFDLFSGFENIGGLKILIGKSLVLFASLVVLMSFTRGIFLFLTRQTIIAMSRRVEYDLRNHLYAHLQSLSLSFYRRNRTGDLMARITEDISRVRMYVGPGIMYTINMISLMVITVTIMLMVNPELTLYALTPLPILSISIYYIQRIVLTKSEQIQAQLSKLTTFTQEIFSGIRVIKAYTKENPSSGKFAEESDVYMDRSMSLVKVEALFFPMVIFLVGLSTLLTVWVGGEKIIAGSLTVGNVAEFLIYINYLTWPIISVGWVTTLIQRAAASQERLNELFEERSEITFVEGDTVVEKADIVFDDVSFTYSDTGIQALKHISFHLPAGKKLGILGPTGSGKSSLCNLLLRLFDPDQGEIHLDGKLLRSLSQSSLRMNIGYAPQDVFLFSDTIHNNIAFGKPDATREEVEEAAKLAYVHHNIVGFPKQFDTLVGERGVTLSGGQKQRISIARAWIRKPKLLILDDVLSAVDTNTEETILQNLRTFRMNHPESSIVMVAHRISCIQDADHIIVIEDGAISESGTHEELIQKEGYYHRIYTKQLLEEEPIA